METTEKMTLSAFLKENVTEFETQEYVASKRFAVRNEKGESEPVKWLLRPISNEEIDKLVDKHTKYTQIKGSLERKREFKNKEYMEELALKTIVYPDLNDEELQKSWGVIGAEDLVKTMLTPGEWTDLQLACSEANGYNSGMGDKVKTVKNS